ncbi:Iai11p KNAG_0B02420 [Huiozyma naganishii CBS 8797]|uniref:Altered inheritance of mitochondria protein 11 n=1 Tax=Huiozyma naganishii (strain ATCC MYA-139 / BCRC 22969 / CBS 8797 / KCTC 17520 / NBRC 10181 / NCYC 3082 / Yp74L-3) TaxID=1071383 RepID=J7S3F0_HUIN7|nr:hypothetical protein KNAG_0B02420 [Kazachstania naganishii CBS 8797]CCK68684.1 hypothetical protein KNAG_0B02420 [Kazachstania naganishii CBS 8797]
MSSTADHSTTTSIPVSEYRERRRRQMLKFFGATAMTLLSMRWTMRLLSRAGSQSGAATALQRFQSNYYYRGATTARSPTQARESLGPPLAATLGSTLGVLTMGITGYAWCHDMESPRRLHSVHD